MVRSLSVGLAIVFGSSIGAVVVGVWGLSTGSSKLKYAYIAITGLACTLGFVDGFLML
jgi:hypothetical protein